MFILLPIKSMCGGMQIMGGLNVFLSCEIHETHLFGALLGYLLGSA
jgi:hypothetical protein